MSDDVQDLRRCACGQSISPFGCECYTAGVRYERARIAGIIQSEIHQWRSIRSSCQTWGSPSTGAAHAQAAIDALAELRDALTEGEETTDA